ncbi:MAG: hypothetical protein IPL10_07535 [Bacteroidetes bacterium]|nr:hypothetical protein [Bacteroidota bacterium]
MSFLKNLFGKKESDSHKPTQDNLPEYVNGNQKVMAEIDIITEAVMAAEEIYTKRDYEVYHVQDFATELPQLQLIKNNNKTLVYIAYTRNHESLEHVFDKERLNDFIKHATENTSDCLVALVNIDDPKQRSAMYFGEPYSYTIKEQFYPTLS